MDYMYAWARHTYASTSTPAHIHGTLSLVMAGRACLSFGCCPQIRDIKGMRCWVDGHILDSSGNVLATCVAQLVDLQQLWAAQRP